MKGKTFIQPSPKIAYRQLQLFGDEVSRRVFFTVLKLYLYE